MGTSGFYANLAVLVAIIGAVLSQQDKGVSVEDVEKITKGVVEQVERERPEAASIGIAATSQASSSATAQGPGSTT